MKIVSVDEDLNLIKSYDIGESTNVLGPDEAAFNRDITTPSNLYYMDIGIYIERLQKRAQEKARERKEAAARRSLMRLA